MSTHHPFTSKQSVIKPSHYLAGFEKPQWGIGAIIFLAFTYILFCLSIFLFFDLPPSIKIVLLLLVTGGLIGGFALHHVMHVFGGHEKEKNLLKEILESTKVARVITDASQSIVLFNHKFRSMMPDFMSAKLDQIWAGLNIPDDFIEGLRNVAEEADRGLSSHIDVKINRHDYNQWLRIHAEPLANFAGHIDWHIEDITDDFERSRAVREEREKLIDFTDNAPVGFFSVDENGKFVFVNATLARWVGTDLQMILQSGKLHNYLLNPPTKANPYDIVDFGGARQIAEVQLKGHGGKIVPASINQIVVVEDSGRVRTRAVVHDLTSERAMIEALEESEDRFRRFFEEAPLGIAIINADMIVADCNSSLAHMLGKSRKETEDKSFAELIDKDDWAHVSEVLRRIQNGESMQDVAEIRLWSEKDKVTVPARMYARRFRDNNNVVLHFIDLTQQKNLETQFIQSQKMQAIGQLAGGIAHDFNNLLTAIIGFCDLLLLRHKPGDPSFGDIQQIKQNSNRAANLVRQLLAFSRQQTLRPKVQDVTDILTELAHLMRRLLGANIELKLVHGDNLGFIKVDGGQMEQVLVNMAVNARDAMSMNGGANNGTLTITTSHFTNRESQQCCGDIMPAGHWVRIDVTDTGCGIAPENMNRILEPFFTTKDVGQGTGLGLATVYGIIRQTGGYLGLESTVGVGTTFSVYLPRLTELEPEDVVQKENVEDTVSDLTGTARILLVEDEDAVRAFSSRALTNKGYEVVTAESGEAGWTVFSELTKPIDLMITDVIMPGMDGPTLVKKIREVNPTLKIIFISGYTEEKLKDYMGDGIYFLPKPFSLKQLAAKVKEVMG
jgi:two-component system cell cycle sensor histidine kinase/response regulator CckA